MVFLKEFLYKFKFFFLFFSFFYLFFFFYDSSITIFLNSKPLDISNTTIGYNSFFEVDSTILIKNNSSIEHFFPLHNEVNSIFTIKNEYFLYIFISTFLSFIFCYPLFIYELYLFILPALFFHEKRSFINFFFFSTFINLLLFFFLKLDLFFPINDSTNNEFFWLEFLVGGNDDVYIYKYFLKYSYYFFLAHILYLIFFFKHNICSFYFLKFFFIPFFFLESSYLVLLYLLIYYLFFFYFYNFFFHVNFFYWKYLNS